METKAKKPKTKVVKSVEVEVISSFYDLQNDSKLREVGEKFPTSEARAIQLKELNLVK